MTGRTPLLFDRALLRRRLARALPGHPDFLLRRAAEDLDERLGTLSRRFPLALDLATPLPLVPERLLRSGKIDRVLRLAALPGPGVDLVGDEENLPVGDGRLDLVVSLLALSGVNDLPGALLQVRRALKPDGLFLGCLFGGDTLHELRAAFAAAESEADGGISPRVASFGEVRALGGLLGRAGFALPVADVETVRVRYATPFALMHDLRAMGLANALTERRRSPLRRRTLLRAAAFYAERFADPDGRVRATFEIVWLSGWAPHGSQQTPLRPGSATVRLADALRAG